MVTPGGQPGASDLFLWSTSVGSHKGRANDISHLPGWICSLEQTAQPQGKLMLAMKADEGGRKAGHTDAGFRGLFCVQKLRAWDLGTSRGIIFFIFCL